MKVIHSWWQKTVDVLLIYWLFIIKVTEACCFQLCMQKVNGDVFALFEQSGSFSSFSKPFCENKLVLLGIKNCLQPYALICSLQMCLVFFTPNLWVLGVPSASGQVRQASGKKEFIIKCVIIIKLLQKVFFFLQNIFLCPC